MTIENTCDTCDFWIEQPDISCKDGMLGQCRAKSPEAMMGDHRPITRWPLTLAQDFCGEYSLADTD